MNDNSQLNEPQAYILVVEDSAAQAGFLCSVLREFAVEVQVAAHGAEALDRLKLRRPVLIISDVMMPVMDGYEFCRRVKAIEEYNGIPFMLLTSLTEPADIFRGLESGADFYNLKPFNPAALVERVRAILVRSEEPTVSHDRAAVQIAYAGRKYSLHAERTQILDLLLASFESIVHKNNELVGLNQKLMAALEANKILSGLIPICGYCKRIRDDRGYWEQVESFVAKHSAATFSHGICPQCFEEHMAGAMSCHESKEPASVPVSP